jgi:quercetin dioxygenase-like cupin family protein
MSVEGLVVEAGRARRIELRESRLDFLVTGKHSKGVSLFEFDAAPGFQTGAHYHTKMEEFFYVLDGEVDLRSGDEVKRAGPGTFVFVPPGVTHSIGNSGDKRARVLMGCSPPGHENYFEELSAMLGKSVPPDPDAIAALRKKYDTIQISELKSK